MHGQVGDALLTASPGALCPSFTPGLAWSVCDAKGVRLRGGIEGFAVLDPERIPTTESTLYDLASLTKPLATALLALQAEDRGEIDLEAEVPGAPFSFLQLLRHEAGYPAWMPVYRFATGKEKVFSWLMDGCPRHPAGERTVYSCLGYILLGLLLEDILQGPLDALFAGRVAGPLGIAGDALFAPSPALRERTAATERGDFHEDEMARPFGGDATHFREPPGWGEANDGNARALGGVAGNAGLFATLSAVERLASAFRPGSGLLSPRALRRAWSPSPGWRSAAWKVSGHPDWATGRELPPGSIGHEGYTGTGVWLEPNGGKTFTLLTNRVHPHHPGTDFGGARASFLAAARALS